MNIESHCPAALYFPHHVEPLQSTRTPEELRRALDYTGKPLAQLCREVGVEYHVAIALMNGYSKGRHGKSHDAAVKLGLKEPA